MIRNLPPPAWRPTPRTRADISLAVRVLAGSAGLSMLEPRLGIACALADAGWLVKRSLGNSRLTRAARYHWKRRAFAVLARHTQMERVLLTGQHPGIFGDPVTHYVDVRPEDWVAAGQAPPPAPQTGMGAHVREHRLHRRRARLEGLRIVPRRAYFSVNPQAAINWRAFRRHFNEVQGFPGTLDRPVDPWRWDKHRGHDLLVAEPFSLPRFLDLPEPAWWDLDVLRLGVLEDGTELTWNLLEIPHALIGGSTRFGKTGLLRLIAWQWIMGCWQRGMQPGVVVLDAKASAEFVCLEVPGYWNPSTMEGVHVALDDVDDEGRLTTLDNMAAAADAVLRELGRRRRAGRSAARDGQQLAFRPILLMVDEAAELLEREAVSRDEQGTEATAARARNRQRASIERAIRTVARLGAAFRVHVIAAAQSPRAEFLPADAKINLAYLLFVGPGNPTELGIIFGKDLPDSPPARPGMGVWKDHREGVDPLDPYLYFKAYWMEPAVIRQRFTYALAA